MRALAARTSIGEIEPRTFSFNSPYGACPTCHGLGLSNRRRVCRQTDYARASLRQRRSARRRIRRTAICPDCHGSRLRAEARGCRLGGKAIHEITALPVTEAIQFFGELSFTADQQAIAAPIVAEILRRLMFLDRVGTEYLTLDRSADTLSGGERQRVRLATGIGSGLVGVLYLLDEPSIGLHPRDNDRLIAALRDLAAAGKYGRRRRTRRSADARERLFDRHRTGRRTFGRPGRRPGHADGGRPNRNIVDGRISFRPCRRFRSRPNAPQAGEVAHAALSGATANNLQDVDVEIPLGLFVCVTGVSGSGKSSLVIDTLGRALARKLNGAEARPAPHRSLRGVNQIDRLVEVDQSPIGRTPRSNPATYTGVWDDIRRVFAGTKQARQRG